MRFIQPKKQNLQKVNWALPDKTIAIVKHYAEYTGYSEEEVLSAFLENILDDSQFITYVENKRNNKRILKDLELISDDLQTPS
ncbi:hypothetical protein KQ939_16770 [Planococcus sp. CP5-4]|uniref:hypothetical protein n=1 Tax=unclassified Planococcus (in: firmicutes) TaxID=2662419 RepID=UPI001C216F7A|nr:MULTISPECIES: hypothetical protein [unclassified Planococcus (in: firmicutes)]MBU9674846.1 hypothetical protein [Planococcus sp. CP5-4_YE]MBV0910725.1 hypothetical protein [Planococcus sp. CP5-4_UN]MBW6065328.1 hypothetical protein [Planococcus sp. CP5-4]